MTFTGTTSEYEATLTRPAAGATAIRILAMDADRVNFGVATRSLSNASSP
jgi:hypothetical protein